MGHPRLLVGEPILHVHAQHTTAHCHLRRVIVSRHLERTNENDGFKMTALESVLYIEWFRYKNR